MSRRALRVVVAATVAATAILAGSAGSAEQPKTATNGAPEPPRVAAELPGTGVAVSGVTGGSLKRCGGLTPDGKGGGCGGPFVLSSGRVEFTIRTLAGDMPFARCLYNYYLRIDGDGRTTMDSIISAGENPCNDVRPCVNRQRTDWLPWRGRIRRLANGDYVHLIDACVDTCLGQFKGRLVMRLARHGRVWRATIDRTQVGDSGFVIGGAEWGWKLPGLKIAPAGSSD